MKEELVRSKNQIGHLTALLRESESNCERLAQLSEALKEEIRRVERKKERKEHLKENTEYLKNVLLKVNTIIHILAYDLCTSPPHNVISVFLKLNSL